MPYEELIKWTTFFQRRPIGWREDQRTYMTLTAAGVKESAETLFPSLKQLRDNIPAEVKALPKGEFLERMLQAKGGDPDWNPPWLNKGKK